MQKQGGVAELSGWRRKGQGSGWGDQVASWLIKITPFYLYHVWFTDYLDSATTVLVEMMRKNNQKMRWSVAVKKYRV